jgi:hypothetical protein
MSGQVVIAGPRNGITAEKIEQNIKNAKLQKITSGKSYKGKKNITIQGFDFRSNDDGGKQCAVTDCENITIKNCIFGNKTTLGQGLNVTGPKTKKVTIENCIFENMSYTESNGAEPCRLGNSQFSGISFECTVRNCIFRNLNSDPEAISIKSCKNVIEDNFFFNNKSNVTVRHGGLTTIQHNYFKGTGGVRLHGYGNKVLYNCFEDNATKEDSFNPIVVRYGNKDKDPNFKDVKTPSEKEGSSHAIYAQTVDNEIKGNEFKNCKKTIIDLEKGAKIAPKNIKKENNPTVQSFKFGNITVPIPPVPPVVEPPVKPPIEEEEQPVVTPTPPDPEPEETHMCGIGRHEEAKIHLHIYACAEHGPILLPKFKQLLRDTEIEYKRQLQQQEQEQEEE